MRISAAPRNRGRFTARPRGAPAAAEQPRPGTHRLGIAHGRDGLLYLPSTGPANGTWPLVLLLHGAGADAADILPVIQPEAERSGFLVLAPDSRDTSWDLLEGDLGPDVAFIDRALASVFRRFAIDLSHLALAGFSDGGSYALSIGLANGDFFSHLIAFSPGFIAPPEERGRPRVFIAHGRRDSVLPIDRCGRRVAPRLEGAGYPVTYFEFDGGHSVPRSVVDRAVRWMFSGERSEESGTRSEERAL